ncbi:MAG: large repetitive protein [Chloroflexia bacterium]|jgi:hypothetical protein|nr:large repetitive protein [Chloroflexia bacterium]
MITVIGGQVRNADSAKAAGSPQMAKPGTAPQVRTSTQFKKSEKSDVSVPLRSIAPRRNKVTIPESEANENAPLRRRSSVLSFDTAVQQSFGPLAMPAPILNFDGEYNEYGLIPPDTNGDVGSNHYIQIVNNGFTIFNKSGVTLYGPANNNTLFVGFGGICETSNAGDPVALYDPMADRWILNWFTGQSNPTHQCIAISSSPDPLGAWYRYDFVTSPVTTAFEDYPHMGVWPDAYYMATNEFGTTNGGGNYAFERARMLVGDPTARMLYFPSADGGLLPSDMDGLTPPPAGSPNYFFEWLNPSPGLLNEYKFHVDWTTGTGTFTGPIPIPVANFNYPTCGNARERCVPQPGTTAQLEVIGDQLMYRVAYRNFGSYESIVLNHTVNATGGSPGIAAPRWYELRDPNNVLGATVFQQGTFYPGDGVHRWMGSIAQDQTGDIAMGYSASSSTLFPSIRYAGRIPTDPLGTFGQGETTLFAGTGSEDFPSAPRWGDYSNISVDPVDDCTFWYTTEYFSQTGLRDWRTRIGTFKFPSCSAQPTVTATPTGTPTTATPTRTATPTQCPGSSTITASISNTDPTQTGRLGLGDPKSSCAVPKAVSALSDTLTRHYRSYNYTNASSGPECVTVSFVQDCGNNAIQSVAYLGSFNPAAIQTNYLADGGASGHTFSYSFTLPAGQTAVIVVLEVSPNLGCTTYTMTVNPCGTGPTPTATSTNTPTDTPTSTPTATNTPTDTATSTGVPPTNTPTNTATSTPAPPSNTPTNTATGTVPTSTSVPATSTATTAPATNTSAPATNTSAPATNTTVASVTATRTSVAGATSTPTLVCTTNFPDNQPGDTFYSYIQCLVCRGVVSGFPDGMFHAGWNITRGQISKVVANAAGFFEDPGSQIYQDVPPGSPYYAYVNRLTNRGLVSGYPCPTKPGQAAPGDTPCTPENPSLFRPNFNATRGQLAKIVSNSAGYNEAVSGQYYADVPSSGAGSEFYTWIMRLTNRGVMSGYQCGTNHSEPCDVQNHPYFRPGIEVTRGQASKIVANTFFPNCSDTTRP